MLPTFIYRIRMIFHTIRGISLLFLIHSFCSAQTSPNIIFILTDDQGWNHISYFADPAIQKSKSDFFETPNMARFARLGIRFTDGYAPNPICSPTRHSILFGQNAARHIYNKDFEWYTQADDKLTIPKALKQANPQYRTAHVGKWHVAIHPEVAGYDVHDGLTSNREGEIFRNDLINARDYNAPTNELLSRKKAANPLNLSQGKPTLFWIDNNPKDIFGLTQRGMAFMDDAIAQQKPFYLQLSHYATHLSLSSTEGSYASFKDKPKGKVHESAEFGAMLKDLDEAIGMIMDYVQDRGIEDNTYVFIMGDNGGRGSLNKVAIMDEDKQIVDAFYATTMLRNEPLRDGKHSFYEGGLRVPFMAMGPGIQPNRMSRIPVTGLDLLPTFHHLAGGGTNLPEIDGGSMASLLKNKNENNIARRRQSLIFHQGSHRPPRSAIRKGQFKLIKYWSEERKYANTPKVELFNLELDPFEKNDLSQTLSEKARILEAEMLEAIDEYGGITERTQIPSAVTRSWATYRDDK